MDTLYTLRVFPESSPFYSFVPDGACEVEFATVLTGAHERPDCDTWYITRMADGVIVAQHDGTERDAMLWRNYRRSELAAQRRAEVEARLKPRIVVEQIAFERDFRRAHREVIERSLEHPADRLWRTMRRNRLALAIEEAVQS